MALIVTLNGIKVYCGHSFGLIINPNELWLPDPELQLLCENLQH